MANLIAPLANRLQVHCSLRSAFGMCTTSVIGLALAAILHSAVGRLADSDVAVVQIGIAAGAHEKKLAVASQNVVANQEYDLAFQGSAELPILLFPNVPSPAVDFGPYSYETASPTAPRKDSINIFFSGAGSVFDVQWDMTHLTYGEINAGAVYDPANLMSFWRPKECEPIQVPDPAQYVLINGVPRAEDLNIYSRDIFEWDPIYFCKMTSDARAYHLRLWDGGVDGTIGSWSVGAVHYDPPDHQGSRYFEAAEDIVALTFMEPAPGGGYQPRWFVQDIWTFSLGNTDPGGGCVPGDPSFAYPCTAADVEVDGYVVWIVLIA